VLQLLRRLTWDQWRLVHEELDPAAAARLDWKPLVVLLTVALSLAGQWYWGDRDTFARIWDRPDNAAWLRGDYELNSFAWWTLWRFVGFFALPALVVVAMPGEKLSGYGFSFRGFSRHVWIYVGLYLAILPLVVAVSYTPAFRTTYPFYKLANRSTFDLLAWEAMYALQFFSLEFFFRGFMLHGLKRQMGAHAIWVMIVPYTMLHFQKPVLECFGAVFAGLVLGTLALRTRSIWCGVLIHASVAITMDLLALGHCPANLPCPTGEHHAWEQMPYVR
jgi:membrane protease YdiL (CAAX protease family)